MLTVGNETLVLTHDALAEGVHVLPDQDPADIAWKLVAVNLSDLAAKGAQPLGILLGYALGSGEERFIEGLREILAQYDVPLLGGDTIATPGPRNWGCTAIGRATCLPVPGRDGARAGDRLFVTGILGAAMLGFEAMGGAGGDEASAAYRRPRPLLAEGELLAPVVTAMMDVSDGLLLDAWRMAEASRVTFALDSGAIPVADPARRDECLRWGDDYQLLFTMAPGATLPVPATPIGWVRDKGATPLTVDQVATPDPGGLGYVHR